MATYLDHAATTPMRQSAIDAMTAQLGQVGNASSLHAAGRRARRVVEESREQIAEALGGRASEVIFTSGGTEADNLALKGLYWHRRTGDARRVKVLVSSIEHHAVLDPAIWLSLNQGADLVRLPVDSFGRLDPEVVLGLLAEHADEIALLSVMWANNEVGAVQPIASLAAIAHDHGIPMHTDAVQAIGALPVSFTDVGVDAMTVTGHKVGGPIGVGALFVRREQKLEPVMHGGGQERDIRSGTLDVPAIAAFAAAVTEAVAEQAAHAKSLAELRDELVRRVLAAVPDARLSGHPVDHLPGIAHFAFPGCEGDSLLLLLDAQNIACSTGSACTAGVSQPSHVMSAMGYDDKLARGSLRFSLGHTSTMADVEALAAAIGPAAERARAAGFSS